VIAMFALLAVALHESAFGSKADMMVCRSLLSWSLLRVKRTCRLAVHMSAFDPKWTCCTPEPLPDYRCGLIRCVTFQRAIGGSDEAARVYHVSRRCGYLVGCGACATS
jgi:hypothetical protein